ncbi:MAG: glycosyltransferase family 4 protein [Anaerolineae bacterium]|nr:glycosyltransferase family 4 protein [Anaerolineae bacterium]
MKIMLNAHLLSAQLGYRSAGIHGYIYNTLAQLSQIAPDDWSFTAFVGKKTPHTFDGISLFPALWDTTSPIKRIIWEQTIQPFRLGGGDLLHSMTFVSPLILPIKSVVTVYDLSFVYYPHVLSASRRLYLRMFTALSCRRAERVIAISQSTARDVAKTFNISPEKIDVAPCGYDASQFYPMEKSIIADFKQKKGLPDRFWLFLGTLEPRKNLTTLLDAYALLPRHERLPLLLGGGKGWLYDAIFARIERYGLEDEVRLLGFLPQDELPFWYNSAEAFLYPSIFEGFGLPVLEAMACGVPVVISDASSLPEVGANAGLCLPPLDVEAWRDALARIYADADWRTGASARGIDEARRYSWQKTAQATIASYQKAFKTK